MKRFYLVRFNFALTVMLAVTLTTMFTAVAAPIENEVTAAQAAQFTQEASTNEASLLVMVYKPLDQIRQTVNTVSAKASSVANNLVGNAMSFLGVPYRRGGTDATAGFDCSGFVRAMYEQTVGFVLPRSADQQAASTMVISREELKPGDLVFFNTMRRAFSHVGIYVGDNKFIHAPRAGKVVVIEDMRVAYWQHRFTGARRVNTPAEHYAAPVHDLANNAVQSPVSVAR